MELDRSGAEISDCGHYRYRLWRRWDARGAVAFLMLNPSTADASTDDPTIRRCMRFARSWGYGSLEVVNLFAWRCSSRVVLLTVPDPIGPLNDAAIPGVVGAADGVVCAWGAWGQGVDGIARTRARVVMELLRGCVSASRIWCLGTTASGHPRHPLYVPAKTALQPCGGVGL
jgi:hypothetical protein